MIETTTVAALRAKLWDLRMNNAPMAERAAVLAEIDAAEKAEGPTVYVAPRRVCCAKAVVSHGCTCGHVTRCSEHGTRHHGTHD